MVPKTATRRPRRPVAPVEDITVQRGYTLADVADLVLVQGYSREHAQRKTQFPMDQINRYLDYQESLR